VFGQLRIEPSADLGDMGPMQGMAAGFDWKWHYSAGQWIIWLALIGAFVVPGANRNTRIVLILVPLAIVNVLWWLFIHSARMNSTDELQFGVIFNSVSVAVTVLWLVAHYFKNLRGSVRLLLSFATIVIVSGLGTLAYSTEFSAEMALFLALFIFIALTMLVAIALSSRFCGGKYRPVRFLLWFALWMILISFVAAAGFVVAGSIIFSSGPPSSAAAIIGLLLAGSVFGLFLYVLNLPFMILGFIHPFFRERFCSCLRLREASAIQQ
jgi:hypothetical protein